ncbi:hypothetical protein GMO_25820 [Gluconobacter morbifer G707]|uniref:Uncharacterized protein n=1 Tax=Gluconobacter morbifer G707 TaxID=1088869 RepID=G6XM64_9PROT|nr:hypothetical protein GMO_25820 [Gluconobacter morbifer G707]
MYYHATYYNTHYYRIVLRTRDAARRSGDAFDALSRPFQTGLPYLKRLLIK